MTSCGFHVYIEAVLMIVIMILPHPRIKQNGFLGDRDLTVRILGSHLRALWADEAGISSVEYALLLAFIAAAIIFGAESLSDAVENKMTDTAALFDEETCGNDGGGNGTGGDGDSGQGGGNTC
jgi:Flp pilus assembly pilin Flp